MTPRKRINEIKNIMKLPKDVSYLHEPSVDTPKIENSELKNENINI